MSLVVNHNLMAANVARNLNTHYGNLSTSTQRLSSGLRINSAADDAAGLAIRELQRADVAAFHQGARNVNDAISLIQVADGALQIIDEKLIRMKELAEQASTGTYDSTQRLMIESEFQAMASEINRIAEATDFNGIHLLDGSLCGEHDGSGLTSTGAMKVHFGTGNDSAEDYYYINIPSAKINNLFSFKKSIVNNLLFQETEPLNRTSDSLDSPVTDDIQASGPVLTKVSGKPKGLYQKHIAVNSENILQEVNGRTNHSYEDMTDIEFEFVNGFNFEGKFDFDIAYRTGRPKITGSIDNYSYIFDSSSHRIPGVNSVIDTSVQYNGANWNITNKQNNVDLYFTPTRTDSTGFTLNCDNATINPTNVATITFYDVNNNNKINVPNDLSVTFDMFDGFAIPRNNTNYPNAKIYDNGSGTYLKKFKIDFNNDGNIDMIGSFVNKTIAEGLDGGRGAEVSSAYASFTLEEDPTPDPTPEPEPDPPPEPDPTPEPEPDDFDDTFTIATQDSAQRMLTRINEAIEIKDKIRADLGALQNRFENTISNLNIMAENLQAAESRISDVDVATEMTEFVRQQILTQSAVAMLAQANSLPQMAMQIIGG